MQRLGQPQSHPDEHRRGECREREEQPPPREDQHDDLAERRREDRDREEDHRRERHHPRHLPAAVAIAHHRHRDHARRRDRGALQHPQRQQDREARREDDADAAGRVAGQATQHQQLAPVAIRQRAVDDRRRAEAQHERGDDPLPLVLVGDAERVADLGQRRQHRIDAERDHRHHRREHGDEFAETDAGVRIAHDVRLQLRCCRDMVHDARSSRTGAPGKPLMLRPRNLDFVRVSGSIAPRTPPPHRAGRAGRE